MGRRLPFTITGASLRPAERFNRYSVAAARSWALTARCGMGFAAMGGGVGIAVMEATGAGRGLPDDPDRLGGRPAGFGATFGAGAGAGACLTADFAAFFATGALAAGLTAFFGAAVLAGFAAFFAGDFAFPAICYPSNQPRSCGDLIAPDMPLAL